MSHHPAFTKITNKIPNPLKKWTLQIPPFLRAAGGIPSVCKILGFLTITGFMVNLWIPLVSAQTPRTEQTRPRVELELLGQPEEALARGVLTAETVSQEGITNPSLWWTRDQFGRQIVVNWLAYPEEKRIDLVVDRQLWSLINYVEKYSLVNHFALTAREYGYNLRIFNDQRLFIGTASCNFADPSFDNAQEPPQTDPLTSTPECQINLVLASDRGLAANRRGVTTFLLR